MWPEGQQAAVSITYDDGHPSNLDIAVPELEERGFRGTFFLSPGVADWVPSRALDWGLASYRGHEIANHSFSHPCPPLWDDPHSRMRQYDAETFALHETGRAEHWLNVNIGKDDSRTYAYICDEVRLGDGPEEAAKERYLDLVRKTFYAARLGHGRPASRADVLANPHKIPAKTHTYGYFKSDKAIEYCEEAAAGLGWAVLIFHYLVDGSPASETETTRSLHNEILDYLHANRQRFWVAPFRDVCSHIFHSVDKLTP